MKQIRQSGLILGFVLIIALSLSVFVAADATKVNTFLGNVSIGGDSSTVKGAVVEAFIGSASTAAKTYTIGSEASQGLSYNGINFTFDVECNAGSIAFLKVWGINASTQTCSNQFVNRTNLSVSLVSNDAACSYANACSSGFCCSGATAINASNGAGVCQAAVCGAGVSVPGFSVIEPNVITAGQTVNFTINISSVLRYNITAANFTLVNGTNVVSRNFTIPSNGRNFNLSYKIFDSLDSAFPGPYNITAVQVDDNGSITNRTAITNMNFTVTSTGITVPGFSLSAASATTEQTINFTINITSALRFNITSANFTFVRGTTVTSKNFTIPSNGRSFNISYQLTSSDIATAGTYNVTAVQINDNGSIVNRTLITNMNFTVTSVAAAAKKDEGGGSTSSGGGGGGPSPVTPAPAPSEETKEAVKESLPEAFKQADAAGNVEITAVAAPEVKSVPEGTNTVAEVIEKQVETAVKSEEAKQVIADIRQAVSSGGATSVQAAGGSVQKSVEVVKATNKVTKEAIVVSVVKLAVVAPKDKPLTNVEVVEVIPKAAASNVNQVSFTGEKPQVLEADPVVKWYFSQVSAGQRKDLSYTINKDIRSVGTTTVGVAGRAEAAAVVTPPPPPAVPDKGGAEPGLPTEIKKPGLGSSTLIMVVVAVIVVAGWIFFKARKKPMK